MRLLHAAAWIAGLVAAITHRIFATREEDAVDDTLGVEVLEEEMEQEEREEKDVEVSQQTDSAGTCDISIFLMSPLTLSAVQTMTKEVDEAIQDRADECKDKPWKVEVFTQSDTLRCNAKEDLGGQLNSTTEACKVLFGDETFHAFYGNLFGDQFNQAWLAEEWGQMMDALLQFKDKGMQLEIYIYPTQASKNPPMLGALKAELGEILENHTQLDKLPNFDVDEINERWGSYTVLKKEYLMWCLTKKKELEFVYDLVTVFDYVVMKDMKDKIHFPNIKSIGAHGTRADWCVHKQPPELANGENSAYVKLDVSGLEDLDMTYIDLQSNGENTAGFCQSEGARSVIRKEFVKVAVPTSPSTDNAQMYKTWVEDGFQVALRETFKLEGGGEPLIDLSSSTDALIIQDTLDADNQLSVVYLLSKVKFRSAKMLLVSQPANFKTHKLRFNSAVKPPTEAIIEDIGDRVPKGMAEKVKGIEKAQVNFSHPIIQTFKKHHDYIKQETGAIPVAWPALVLKSSGNLELAQPAKDELDTALMKLHNWWRWEQNLHRYELRAGVELLDGGVPTYSPMSHTIVPYTSLFFKYEFEDASDFVLSLEDFDRLTSKDEGKTDNEILFTEGIRKYLRWVYQEVQGPTYILQPAARRLHGEKEK